MYAPDEVSGKADNSGPVCIIVVALLSVIGAVITPIGTVPDAGPPKANQMTDLVSASVVGGDSRMTEQIGQPG